MAEGSVIDRMKEKAKDIHAGVTEKIADFSEAGMGKVKEMLAEVNAILPFITELGYTTEGISVGIGLMPDISIEVSGLTKTMDETTYQRILEEQKEREVLVAILKALQTASALQSKIKFFGMRADVATITISLPSKLTLKFKKIG
jgi:hypothetical protein